MKEIKLRAWGKTQKKFVFEGGLYQLELSIRQDADWLQSKLEWIQFTGLKDKNGKEIYEGDILNCGKHYIDNYYKDKKNLFEMGIVKFKIYDDGEGYQTDKHIGWFCYGTLIDDVDKGCEIIGNIYENPELLK